MRRFECKDPKSHKFWAIDLDGEGFTVRYGKFGTEGQSQIKTFASADKARVEAEKAIKSKTHKGYAEVEVTAQTQPKAGGSGARNLELEAAIVANPKDLDAWQVYFDWLQTQGDPWGERGNLAIAQGQARGAAKAKLAAQIASFDRAQGEALYGKSLLELMSKSDFRDVAQLDHRYGLIMSATVKSPNYEWNTAPNKILAALVKSPAARLLATIKIGLMDLEYPVGLKKGIDAITKAGKLESLRSLFIGDFKRPNEQEISWISVGKIGKLLPIAPKLRSLSIRGGEIDLRPLEHDYLEHLKIETGGLPGRTVASIGACKLPALTHMEVWFGTKDYGGGGKIRQLAGLLEGQGVPKLVELGLKNCEWQDDIAVALASSKLLAQLKTLDLSMGTLHGPGVEAILANDAKFAGLERLDLSRNFMSGEQCAQLRAAFGNIVDVSGQDVPEDWSAAFRYLTGAGE